MNDHDLEDTLRSTFAGRAGTVTRGPVWDGADEFVATPAHRRRARWVAPLAAAAAVLAVVGVVLGLRDSSGTNGWTSPAAQRPVPAGMKAVDALGVEIFVPSKWMVDAGPCPFDGVRRPIAEPESWRGAKCAQRSTTHRHQSPSHPAAVSSSRVSAARVRAQQSDWAAPTTSAACIGPGRRSRASSRT